MQIFDNKNHSKKCRQVVNIMHKIYKYKKTNKNLVTFPKHFKLKHLFLYINLKPCGKFKLKYVKVITSKLKTHFRFSFFAKTTQ